MNRRPVLRWTANVNGLRSPSAQIARLAPAAWAANGLSAGIDPSRLIRRIQLRLDGQAVATPHSFVGVVGIRRTLEAVSPQGAWTFSSWSDGGSRIHTIATPAASATYTARFTAQTAVAISITDASVQEGHSGTRNVTFTVRLSAARSVPVSVAWRTVSGTAKAGTDYTAASGTVTFPAGSTSRTITVAVRGDTVVDGTEVFFIDLFSPAGAPLADARAVGSILNDDGTRSFQVPITNDTLDESNETVNPVLSSPGAGAVLGTPRTALLTILDDD
jgi:Calx-beta domain